MQKRDVLLKDGSKKINFSEKVDH